MNDFKKREFRRISCPLKYGECFYTDEFNKLTTEEGWQVEKAMIDHGDMCVRFLLSREVQDDG